MKYGAVIAMVLLASSPVMAEGVNTTGIPLACSPQDSHTMCAIEVMRNNIANEEAYWIGRYQDKVDQDKFTVAYWAHYVLGVILEKAKAKSYWLNYLIGDDPISPRLRLDLGKVCSWNGQRTDDQDRMCSDWRKQETRRREATTARPYGQPSTRKRR